MSMTKEQRRAYREKRAGVLRSELNAAIETADKERFADAYGKLLSCDYMRAKERKEFYHRFLKKLMEVRS